MSLIQAHRAALRQNIRKTRVVALARGAHGYKVRIVLKLCSVGATTGNR